MPQNNTAFMNEVRRIYQARGVKGHAAWISAVQEASNAYRAQVLARDPNHKFKVSKLKGASVQDKAVYKAYLQRLKILKAQFSELTGLVKPPSHIPRVGMMVQPPPVEQVINRYPDYRRRPKPAARPAPAPAPAPAAAPGLVPLYPPGAQQYYYPVDRLYI